MWSKIFILFVFFFFIACGSDKKTVSENDKDVLPDETEDVDSDLLDIVDAAIDEDEEGDVDLYVDPTTVVTCPEVVDETAGSVECTIVSNSNNLSTTADDTCRGNISENDGKITYSFYVSEQTGPSSCVVGIINTDTEETVQTSIKIDEVNQVPAIYLDGSAISFYEGTPKEVQINLTDNDYPKEDAGDPGFLNCLIEENECGDWVTVEKTEDLRCQVAGTMPESMTDGTCTFKLVVEDGYGARGEDVVEATLIGKNDAPVWTTDTVSISPFAGATYNEINGIAMDNDLPNMSDGDPGFLTCVYISDTCSFPVSVTGEKDLDGEISCRVNFTAGDVTESCSISYHVSDGTNNLYPQNYSVAVDVVASVSINCPESVNEGEEIVCDITAIGGDPVNGALDTCRGTLSKEDELWKYRYMTTENDGPGECVASVSIDSATSFDTIEIKEVNEDPSLSFYDDCTEATEETLFRCRTDISDIDFPNTETTDPGFRSCEIKNNTCGDWLVFDSNCNGSGSPSETVGGTECSYTVEVTDGYDAVVSETVTITIIEGNMLPYFKTDLESPVNLMTNESYSFTFTIKDDDLPNTEPGDPGYVYCKDIVQEGTASITSSLSITGEGAGIAECSVEIMAEESITIDYALSDSFTIGIEDGLGSSNSDSMTIELRKCVFYTTPDASGVDGRTWDDAMSMFEVATHAWSGCEVWAKQGTYTPLTSDGDSVLVMNDGVTLLGGFAGYEDPHNSTESLRSRPEPLVHSVLDGESSSYHVVIGASDGAQLDGFIIQNGNAVGTDDEDKLGGGMYNVGSLNLTVTDCLFKDNYAELGGGAIYNEGAFEDFTEFNNCTFTNNSAGYQGGAVLSKDSINILYQNCEFTYNSANHGGVLAHETSSSTIKKSKFQHNSAVLVDSQYGNGGVVLLEFGSSVDIENSLFSDNSADSSGGVIDLQTTGNITVNFSTFANNSANSGGAFVGGSGTISNSIFWDSSVDDPDNYSINYSYGTGATTGDGNIDSISSGSAMFINDIDNFYLDSTSPVIDAADPAATLADDFENNERPQGEARDMGAYEYESVKADKFVDCDASTSGDGNTWTDAYNTIQEAVDSLPDGGTVFITGYCKYSDSGLSDDYLVQLHDDIRLYGGFNDDAQYLRDRTNPITNRPVLDGENENITIINADTAKNIVVDGLIIQNAGESGLTGTGGGTIVNTIFQNNLGSYGGAINISSATEEWSIVNSLFEQNRSSFSGGAIYAPYTDFNIINSTFVHNNVIDGYNSYGLALYIPNSNVNVVNSIFYQNVANYSGNTNEIYGGTVDNTTYSFISEIDGDTNISGDPGFVNVPDVFALVTQSHVDYIYLGTDPGTITTGMLLQFDGDTELYTVDSIGGGGDIYFLPTLTTAVAVNTPVSFWSAGTTETDTTLDLNLKSDSQSIGVGTYREESIYDIDGNRRFDDGDAEILFDIGAYEY